MKDGEREFGNIVSFASDIMQTLGVQLKVPRLASKQTQRYNVRTSDPNDYWEKQYTSTFHFSIMSLMIYCKGFLKITIFFS